MILPNWVKENSKFPAWILENFNMDEVEVLETNQGWIVVEANGDGTSNITKKEEDGIYTYTRCYPVGYTTSGEPMDPNTITMEINMERPK